MRNFFLALALFIGAMVWLRDWAATGKMDNFIAAREDPDATPAVLDLLARMHDTFGEDELAVHYAKWLIRDYPGWKGEDRTRYRLGLKYEGMGRRDLAKEQFDVLKDSFTHTNYGKLGRIKSDSYRY
ncbi:MAG: hypothetical protein A2902_07535 [Elusimicrobia bacterium RIFCSPLOWO2_01_FULL_64_13]|nr:MAG: hypothetical protein A2636_00220 [Elusimicrobia bacterium RIFCSPHIGHO2_01_FULL_64_10]OGR94484.1 MAG: hypothetical protein A2902_07535 [Elusimicrobia bacterium RIFCSPLOWO2_01_FULL_64_13]